ncbi:uncharacterized protein H6S33_004324 [Morchella sextelata]|uniref:uncharacterized protein n=1 Tax=Morchella sextelata TaxID=1174677 RepID=UPI001D053F9E|nr:uncharacterized protein H6S33_004324 [Morchella sextelata]KAH0605867.1 hypothetical protein H6S33_004324 [Morchella sextelata]
MGTITLYTNHACPFAHRAHIALEELGVEFKEVIIDLDTPREPWYLEINPRGLVPTIKYNEHIITESSVITQFLADLKESHLLPASGTLDAALKRARIAFFVDTFNTKIISGFYGTLRADSEEEKIAKGTQFVETIEKEIAPLLEGAGPFFGGSKELTLAEVNTASFVVRIDSVIKAKDGWFPDFVGERLKENKNWTAWTDAVLAKPSVTNTWDEAYTEKMKKRFLASKQK